MNVKAFLVVTLFLGLGPSCSSAIRAGRSSVSLSRSSSRSSSSSSVSSSRSSSASSTYRGSRYTVISARASVYGYAAYTARGTGNYDPTVCFNNDTLSDLQNRTVNESTSLGYYVCPLPDDSDSMYCCCGPDEAQYCCTSLDYNLMYYSGHIFGAAGAALVLIAFCVGGYLKRKFKKRTSVVRQHESHAEATRHEAQPPSCSTNMSYVATSYPITGEGMNVYGQHGLVTSIYPPNLYDGSRETAKYPNTQYSGDLQLSQYQQNAPSQVPLCESLPPKYEDVLASNDYAVRSSS